MKVKFTNMADSYELFIVDEIGGWGVCLNDIKNELDNANNKPLNIHINSGGGSVFEGFAIYNLIKNYQGYKTVFIEGIAASIASVIAMSADSICMNEASMMMIHNASGGCYGTSKEMEQIAEALEKINNVIKGVYEARTKLSSDKIKELMDNETYMTSSECLEYGFCDKVMPNKNNEDAEEVDQDAQIKLLNNVKNLLEEIKNNVNLNKSQQAEPCEDKNDAKKLAKELLNF